MIKPLTYTLLFILTLFCWELGGKVKNSGVRIRKDSLTAASQARQTAENPIDSVFSFSDEYLDTVQISKNNAINDYTLLGLHYGVALNRQLFNPSKEQGSLLTYRNFGLIYTRYGKMFGYMPYFGLQAGLNYREEGYFFPEPKTGSRGEVDGAYRAVYKVVELPFNAQIHIDFWKMKLMLNLGLYGGYRLSVSREGEKVPAEYRKAFYAYDRRWDYGGLGGAGFALVFDPVELHFTATAKISMSSLYKADYASELYYRYAYPFDIYISAGLHFQLTKRLGRTRASLRREARETVRKEAEKRLEVLKVSPAGKKEPGKAENTLNESHKNEIDSLDGISSSAKKNQRRKI